MPRMVPLKGLYRKRLADSVYVVCKPVHDVIQFALAHDRRLHLAAGSIVSR